MKTPSSILTVLLLFLVLGLNAQIDTLKVREYMDTATGGLYYYDVAKAFPTNQISEDYGPRDVKEFHGGLDFNNPGGGDADVHDLLLGIEDTATVVLEDGVVQNNYSKWITLKGDHYYRYIHILKKGLLNDLDEEYEYGGCIVKFIENADDYKEDWAIIFRDSGTYSAIGPTVGTVAFTREDGTQDTLDVTNKVLRYQPIASLGNSKNFVGKGHLHLEIIDSTYNDGKKVVPGDDPKARNPLRYLHYPKASYNIVLSDQGGADSIRIKYGGDRITDIRYKIEAYKDSNGDNENDHSGSRYDEILDINSFRIIIIADEGGNQEVIKGGFYEADISLGGRYGEIKYPSSMINDKGSGARGTWQRTGVYSRAYWTNPYDYFYFSDFATRIHEADPLEEGGIRNRFADIPEHARYNDGKYFIAGIVNTIKDDSYTKLDSILIDNFKPYISQVQVSVNGDLVYWRNWDGTDPDSIRIGDGYIQASFVTNGPTSETNGIVINTMSSEPLKFLKAHIPNLDADTINGTMLDGSSTNWRFDFGSNDTLQIDSCYTIEFFGEDLSNNQILNLGEMSEGDIESSEIRIPTREDHGSASSVWNPTDFSDGVDNVHEFCLSTSCTDSLKGGLEELRMLTSCLIAEDVEISLQSTTQNNSNGAIFINLLNGTAPFSFQWKDENDNVISHEQNLENVPAGTYCFEIEDALCCKISGCKTIKNCTNFIEGFLEEPACNNTEGNVIVLVDGELSTPPYSYQWDNGMNSKMLINVPSNTYCVTVTDAGGCTATACHDLMGSFTLDAVITNSCMGDFTGSIELSVEGGASTEYYYSWEIDIEGESEYEYEEVADSLNPGIYCVTVTDETECSIEACYEVLGGTDPNFAIQIDELTCVCEDGRINVTILGDSGPYEVVWFSDHEFEQINGGEDIITSTNGVYNLEVYNSYGCRIPQVFNVPSCDFNIDNFDTNITHACQGENSGSINIQTDLIGVSPYRFVWEDYNGNIILEEENETGFSEANNLEAGEYFLTVLTANGCQTSSNVLLIEGIFEAPDVTYTITPATNDYTNDGAIDLTVSGNSNDYSYQWSSLDFPGYSETTQDIDNLAEGNYTVEIFYEGGLCSITLTIDVWICEDLSDDLEVFSTVTPMSPAEDDGAIDITLEGVDHYEFNYLWISSQQGFPKTTQDITGLSAGTYCLKISHPTCTDLSYQQCFEICDFGLEIRSTGFNDCNGTTLVAISTEQVNYQWSSGETTETIFANYNEEYCVTATDITGCQAVRCTTIIPPPLELSFDITDATLGNSNGSVTANVTGGFPPYSYNWLGGATGHKIVWLDPGMYPIVVTDDCGNTISGTAIVECEIGQDQVQANITPVTCGNFSTGSIDLTVNPSNGNVFTWSNGATTEDIDGLIAGTYSVTIVNTPTGCEYTQNYTVETSGQGDFHISFLTQPICNGVNGGIISAVVSGGTSPYTYEWRQWGNPNPFPETSTLNDVAFGWYLLIVTDATGCSDSQWGYISPAGDPIEFDVAVNPEIVCPGQTADATMINISGGDGQYTYEWRRYTGEFLGNSLTINDLNPGWYIAEVTDGENCIGDQFFEVDVFDEININAEMVHICTPDIQDGEGSITIEVSGGNPPYQYRWFKGGDFDNVFSTEASIENLFSDSYYLQVFDDCGDFAAFGQSIYLVEDAEFDASITGAGCIAPYTGAIDLNVIDGYPPQTYTWSNGATSQDVDNLSPGTYGLTVSYGAICEKTSQYSFTIEANTFDIVIQDLHRPSNTDPAPNGGYIDIEVLGNAENEPYTYQWNNGATSEDIHNLSEGFYSVTVTDANGCTEVEYIPLYLCPENYSSITLETKVYPAVGFNDGRIELIINGGNPPYYITWTKANDPFFQEYFISNQGEGLDNLTTGDYFVTVTDGCSDASTWRPIRMCQTLLLDEFVIKDICPLGDNKGHIWVTVDGSNNQGDITPYEFRWTYNGYQGEQLFSEGISENHVIQLNNLMTGGTYCLEVSTYAGCITEKKCFTIIRTYDVAPLNWNNNSTECTFRLSCPGSNDFEYISEHLSVEFTPNAACEAYLMCPIDGSLSDTPIYGQEYWSELVENQFDNDFDPNNDCIATKICYFNIGGNEISLFNDYEYVNCCEGCIDNDGDGIPVPYDQDDNDDCIPPPSNNENCEQSEPPSDPYAECDCEAGCFFEENLVTCSIDRYCLYEDGTASQEPEETIYQYEICIDPVPNSNCGYFIFLQCTIDPCNKFNFYTCDVSGSACPETTLNEELQDYGYDGYIDCDAYTSCCTAVADNLPSCIPCNPLTQETEQEARVRSQEKDNWMQSFGIINQSIAVEVFPNPFTNEITARINLMEEGEIAIKIIDILGREVENLEYRGVKGINIVEFTNLEKLNTGVYQLIVIDKKGNLAVQEIVHQKQ